ncbi:dienelactone hydrolase family protein [Mucilaginibacter koreensis]
MIKYYRILILGMLSLGLAFPVLGQGQVNSAYERGSYISKGDTLPYRILFPLNFNPAQKYPLLIVLHGGGERGNDNEAQLKWGSDLFLRDSIRNEYRAIVVFPQCSKDSYWSNVKIDTVDGKRTFHFREGGEPTKAMHALLGLIDQLTDKPYINTKRIYAGGLSMGGMGTFELLRRKPKLFGAAFTIAGGDNTNNAKAYAKRVPLWIFHGEKDDVVPADHSRVMITAIQEAGGNPKLTLYPNDTHNSWTDAFNEPAFLFWLFSHHL